MKIQFVFIRITNTVRFDNGLLSIGTRTYARVDRLFSCITHIALVYLVGLYTQLFKFYQKLRKPRTRLSESVFSKNWNYQYFIGIFVIKRSVKRRKWICLSSTRQSHQFYWYSTHTTAHAYTHAAERRCRRNRIAIVFFLLRIFHGFNFVFFRPYYAYYRQCHATFMILTMSIQWDYFTVYSPYVLP